MITNEFRKYLKSLQRIKYRQKYNKFIAEGPKICTEILEHKGEIVEHILYNKEMAEEIANLLDKFKGKTIQCNEKDLKSVSSLKNPNKILIVAKQLNYPISKFAKEKQWAIYLDRIQDPGNLGTIMRIADWFDISWVIASEDSCDFYNPKVIQAAMGAHLRVSVGVLPRNDLIRDFQHLISVLDLEGEDISKAKLETPGILVIGNESSGISDEIRSANSKRLTINKYGGAESLNASVACGIACYALKNNGAK